MQADEDESASDAGGAQASDAASDSWGGITFVSSSNRPTKRRSRSGSDEGEKETSDAAWNAGGGNISSSSGIMSRLSSLRDPVVINLANVPDRRGTP